MPKKPKPIGRGDYTVCRECRGTGKFVAPKKSVNSRNPNEKQGIARYNCTFCRGFGWVDANH